MSKNSKLSTRAAAKLATPSEARPEANAVAGRPPFDVFHPESEDIENYLERMQEYFIAFDIKDDTDNGAKR